MADDSEETLDLPASIRAEIDGLRDQIDSVASEVEGVDLPELERRVADLEEAIRDQQQTTETHADRLGEVEEALTNIVGGMMELREGLDDGQRGEGGTAGPSREERVASEELLEIKRTAARDGIATAACGACNESIEIHLLPEPACYHCGTTLRGLHPGGKLFDKPRLTGQPVTDGTH